MKKLKIAKEAYQCYDAPPTEEEIAKREKKLNRKLNIREEW